MIALVGLSAITGTQEIPPHRISEKLSKAEMPAIAGTPSNGSVGSNNRGARNRREVCMKVFNSRE